MTRDISPPSAIKTAIALLNRRPLQVSPAQEAEPATTAACVARANRHPDEQQAVSVPGKGWRSSRSLGPTSRRHAKAPVILAPTPLTRLELEVYSYLQLSRLWHRSVGTLRNWVSADRRAGFPIYGVYRLDQHHRRREFLIRGDSASAVWSRHVYVRLTRYVPRGRRT